MLGHIRKHWEFLETIKKQTGIGLGAGQYIENVLTKALGDDKDALDLYSKLQNQIIPKFYDDRGGWVKMMKESIKTSVDFTSQRMVSQYYEMFYKK